MRRYLLLFLFILIASPVLAQNTTVSGTITDSGGQTWTNGSFQIQFFPGNNQPPFLFNGAPFNSATRFNGVMDGSGHFTQIVPDNNFITPANTQWTFTVCPNANSQCFSTTLKVSGASQNVTSSIIPPAIVVQGNAYNQPTAYADSEIAGATWGFIYYNTSSNQLRQCNGPLPCTWIAVTGGGGGTPSPPNLSFQYDNAGVFGGSSLLSTDAGQTTVTDSGILNVTGVTDANGGLGATNGNVNVIQNLAIKGPSPWADITEPAYGATTTVIHTTGTGGVGTSITVGVNTFQNGNGITIAGGGAAASVGTPSSPTVSPGESMLLISNYGGITPGLGCAGSSTYQYTVFAEDSGGGLSIPATPTTISNGAATLGLQTDTLNSLSITGNTISIGSASNHCLAQWALVHITSTSTNSGLFSGWFDVSTINSATTATIPNTYQYSATTQTAASATLTYWVANAVSWPTVTNAVRYWVCTKRPGDSQYHIIGTALPGQTQFNDFGFNLTQTIPWYVSASQCTGGASQPKLDADTVAGGGGTTALTLTNGLTTAVTSAAVRLDNQLAVSSAALASQSLSAMFIPAGAYEINSALNLPQSIGIIQSGNLIANSTISVGFATNWSGISYKGAAGAVQFSEGGFPPITCNASPCILAPNPGSLNMNHININGADNGVLVAGPTNNSWGYDFDHVNFVTGTDDNDKMGLAFFGPPGVAKVSFEHVMFFGGPNQTIDETWAPLILGAGDAVHGGATFNMEDVQWNRRGLMMFQAGGGAVHLNVHKSYRQGGITPLYAFANSSGVTGGDVWITDSHQDSEQQATLAIWGITNGGVALDFHLGMNIGPQTDTGGIPSSVTASQYTGPECTNDEQMDGGTVCGIGWAYKAGQFFPTNNVNLNGLSLVNGQGLNFNFLDGVGNGSTVQPISPLGANFTAYLPKATGQLCVEGLAGCLSIADAGTANAYSGCPVPALTSYSTPFTFELSGVLNANTGPSTVNLCSLGAKTIKKNGGTVAVGADLASNDFKVGGAYLLYFDGTNMNVLSQLGNITGGGTVGITGSPSNGNLTGWSSGTTITNTNLTGDVTTSNTAVTTIASIKGTPVNCTTAAVGQLLTVIAGPQYQCIYPGVNYNPQTADYPLVCPTPDRLGYVDFVGTDTLTHTFTLPQAGSTACLQSSVSFIVSNHSNRSEPTTPVTLTLKATTSNIDGIAGATGIPLTAGESRFIYSDAVSGTGNYHTVEIPASDGGINTQTVSYTATLSDWNKTVLMNCTAACTFTLPNPPPVGKWKTNVMSIGTTLATVSLNTLNFNGTASIPVLNSFQAQEFRTDGSNYFGSAPLVASTNVTFTPSSNGLAISSSGGGGGGVTIQTNGVNNTTQTTLNFQTTSGVSGITATNPSAGNEQFAIANVQGSDAKVLSASSVGTTAYPLTADANAGASSLSLVATTLTDGATVTWAIGSVFEANASLTFTVHSGSRTLNITNPLNGGTYLLKLVQDATGGEGLTLGTGCTWKVINGGSGAVTLSTGANAQDLLTFYFDGTNCYANLGKNYN